MQDTLALNNGKAKGMAGRAQALPNACCALATIVQNINIL